MHCQACGETLSHGEQYCSSCGVSVNKGSKQKYQNDKPAYSIKFYSIFYIFALISIFIAVGTFSEIKGSAIRETVAALATLNASIWIIGARIIHLLETSKR